MAAPMSPPQRIILTGFMGAGKSAVGLHLAQTLGRPFVDLDDEIVRAEGKSVAEIFDSVGETQFREIEHRALRKALLQDRMVLALGGGTLELEGNREVLFADPENVVIYLKAPLEVLIHRCEEQRRQQSDTPRRPVLENRSELTGRFLRRKLLYESAHWTISTENCEAHEVARKIADRWKQGTAPSKHAEVKGRA